MREVVQAAYAAKLDFLDMSLWDVRKAPNDETHAHKSLLGWFTDLPRGETRLGGAGKIMSAEDAAGKIRAGADVVQIYTGLIYRGPDLVTQAARAIQHLREAKAQKA